MNYKTNFYIEIKDQGTLHIRVIMEVVYKFYRKGGSSVPMILMPSQSDKECIPSNQVKI